MIQALKRPNSGVLANDKNPELQQNFSGAKKQEKITKIIV